MDEENVLGDVSTDEIPEDSAAKQQPADSGEAGEKPSPGSGQSVPDAGDPHPDDVFSHGTGYPTDKPGEPLADEADHGELSRRLATTPGASSDVPAKSASDASPQNPDTTAAPRELDEIREILFSRERQESQLGLLGLEERIDAAREVLREQVQALEGRLREEFEGFSAGLANAQSSSDLSSVEEILNLVIVAQDEQRLALESHARETKASLDQLLSLVRELASTMVIMIAGEGDAERGASDEPTPQADDVEGPDGAPREGGSDDAEVTPALTPQAESERDEAEQPSSVSEEADGDQDVANVDPPNGPDADEPLVEEVKKELGILNLKPAHGRRRRR